MKAHISAFSPTNKWPLILVIALSIFVAFVSGCANPGEPVSLEAKAQEIENSLMCPICPGQTIAESQAALSQQMRSIVHEKLAQGATKEEILQFFVERYGERILAEPPKTGSNLVLWVTPFLGIGVGGFFLFRLMWAMRNKALSPKKRTLTMSEQERQYWEDRIREDMNKGESS